VRCPYLESIFPKLTAAGYEKTSEATGYPPKPGAYNCIAWAASDTQRGFWWPNEDAYWPFWSSRELSIPSFVRAFRWLGYRVCGNSRLEFAFEKVALYTINKEPKHMARQLSDGTWTSKCGGEEDITHYTLDALESYGPDPPYAEYGYPELYMKRFVLVSWVVRFLQAVTRKIELLWH
jgi:hypothetical protein